MGPRRRYMPQAAAYSAQLAAVACVRVPSEPADAQPLRSAHRCWCLHSSAVAASRRSACSAQLAGAAGACISSAVAGAQLIAAGACTRVPSPVPSEPADGPLSHLIAARLLSHSIASHSRAADAKSARLLHVASLAVAFDCLVLTSCRCEVSAAIACGLHTPAADAKSVRRLACYRIRLPRPPMRRQCGGSLAVASDCLALTSS